MSKSKRYNKKGIHSDLYLKLIRNKRSDFDVPCGEIRPISIPKPFNDKELAILSKFIFGVELTVKFDYFTTFSKLTFSKLRSYNNDSFRKMKLEDISLKLKLEEKEHFNKNEDFFLTSGNKKMVFLELRYICGVQHNTYYDWKFENIAHDGFYDVDEIFWDHCIGDIYCGGIGGSCYGQVRVTSINDYKRLMKWHENPDAEVRPEFMKRMKALIKENEVDNG